jgi:hypothetical protein
MITLDISHITQLLEAQFLDTVNLQDAKTLREALRRTI